MGQALKFGRGVADITFKLANSLYGILTYAIIGPIDLALSGVFNLLLHLWQGPKHLYLMARNKSSFPYRARVHNAKYASNLGATFGALRSLLYWAIRIPLFISIFLPVFIVSRITGYAAILSFGLWRNLPAKINYCDQVIAAGINENNIDQYCANSGNLKYVKIYLDKLSPLARFDLFKGIQPSNTRLLPRAPIAEAIYASNRSKDMQDLLLSYPEIILGLNVYGFKGLIPNFKDLPTNVNENHKLDANFFKHAITLIRRRNHVKELSIYSVITAAKHKSATATPAPVKPSRMDRLVAKLITALETKDEAATAAAIAKIQQHMKWRNRLQNLFSDDFYDSDGLKAPMAETKDWPFAIAYAVMIAKGDAAYAQAKLYGVAPTLVSKDTKVNFIYHLSQALSPAADNSNKNNNSANNSGHNNNIHRRNHHVPIITPVNDDDFVDDQNNNANHRITIAEYDDSSSSQATESVRRNNKDEIIIDDDTSSSHSVEDVSSNYIARKPTLELAVNDYDNGSNYYVDGDYEPDDDDNTAPMNNSTAVTMYSRNLHNGMYNNNNNNNNNMLTTARTGSMLSQRNNAAGGGSLPIIEDVTNKKKQSLLPWKRK